MTSQASPTQAQQLPPDLTGTRPISFDDSIIGALNPTDGHASNFFSEQREQNYKPKLDFSPEAIQTRNEVHHRKLGLTLKDNFESAVNHYVNAQVKGILEVLKDELPERLDEKKLAETLRTAQEKIYKSAHAFDSTLKSERIHTGMSPDSLLFSAYNEKSIIKKEVDSFKLFDAIATVPDLLPQPLSSEALEKINQKQEEAKTQLNQRLLDSAIALHKAAEWERKLHNLATLIADCGSVSASGTENVDKVTAALRIISQEKTKEEKASAYQVLGSGIIKSPTGYGIQVKTQDGEHGSFSMNFPGYFLGRGYYTSPEHKARRDLRCLAELVKKTGSQAIVTKITMTNPKVAMHLAREAYKAAMDAGFAEENITINVTALGKVFTQKEKNELFKEKDSIYGREVEFDYTPSPEQTGEDQLYVADNKILYYQQRQNKNELNRLRDEHGLDARADLSEKDLEEMKKNMRTEVDQRKQEQAKQKSSPETQGESPSTSIKPQ